MKGILFKNNECKKYSFKNFEELKKELECENLEAIIRRSHENGEYIYIICDEDGKLKDNKVTTGICFMNGIIAEELVGPLFICRWENNKVKSMNDRDWLKMKEDIKGDTQKMLIYTC